MSNLLAIVLTFTIQYFLTINARYIIYPNFDCEGFCGSIELTPEIYYNTDRLCIQSIPVCCCN